jgi:hypothetical protein
VLAFSRGGGCIFFSLGVTTEISISCEISKFLWPSRGIAKESGRVSSVQRSTAKSCLHAIHVCVTVLFEYPISAKRLFKIPWLQVDLVSWLQTFLSGSKRLACERRSTETIV